MIFQFSTVLKLVAPLEKSANRSTSTIVINSFSKNTFKTKSTLEPLIFPVHMCLCEHFKAVSFGSSAGESHLEV